MEAVQDSTPAKLPADKSVSDLINDAINAKHAVEATARALADVVGRHGCYTEMGMYEALLLSLAGLGNALCDAADAADHSSSTEKHPQH